MTPGCCWSGIGGLRLKRRFPKLVVFLYTVLILNCFLNFWKGLLLLDGMVHKRSLKGFQLGFLLLFHQDLLLSVLVFVRIKVCISNGEDIHFVGKL